MIAPKLYTPPPLQKLYKTKYSDGATVWDHLKGNKKTRGKLVAVHIYCKLMTTVLNVYTSGTIEVIIHKKYICYILKHREPF